jgi:transcriptional regulator with XRE-family HTH domain
MPTEDHGSTVPRRQLGRYLRRAREEAQVTVKAAADALEWSTPRIWRIENGTVGMRALDVKAMCELYEASPELTEALTALARETKAKGWWQSYGDALPSWFELYVGLEAAASRIRYLQSDVVPGLLQTTPNWRPRNRNCGSLSGWSGRTCSSASCRRRRRWRSS